MVLVSMSGRVAGAEKTGSISQSGSSYVVEFDDQTRRAGSLNAALETLGNRMRDYLKSAWGKEKLPWGLKITARGHSAVYGDYPRFAGGGAVSPLKSIREGFKEDHSPLAAISNAIKFAREALKL